MDSNIALIGSIVIGGIFLLGVMNFYGGMVDHSVEKGIELRTQQTAANLIDIMEYDFRRMGSGSPTPSEAIISYPDSTNIAFQADVDPTDTDIESVHYYLGNAATGTENPDDKELYRIIDGTDTLKIAGVIEFWVKLYNNTSAPAGKGDASTVEIHLLLESTYGYKKNNYTDDKYAGALWRRKITPKNMIR